MLSMGEGWQWVGVDCKRKVEIIKQNNGDKNKGQILKGLLVKLRSLMLKTNGKVDTA